MVSRPRSQPCIKNWWISTTNCVLLIPMSYIGIMKTLKFADPRITTKFVDAIIDCEDAAHVIYLNGKEVAQIQVCGSSSFARWGYGVTFEIPGKPGHFYTHYEIKTVKSAQEILVDKLVEYGIM